MKKTTFVLLALLFLSAGAFAADMYTIKVNSDVPVNFGVYNLTPGGGGGGPGNYSYDPMTTSEELVPNTDYNLIINGIDGKRWNKIITLPSSNDKVTLVTKTGDSLTVTYCQEGSCPESAWGKYNLHLNKGWNMVPYEILNYVSNCPGSQKVAYIYSPSAKRYVGPIIVGSTSQFPGYDIFIQDITNNLYQSNNGLGAMWLYLSNSCDVSAKFNIYLNYTNQVNAYPQGMFNLTQDYLNKFKIVSGWNFINIAPWMLGKDVKTALSKCNVTGLNQWDADSQKWINTSSSDEATKLQGNPVPITYTQLGKTFVVRVGTDCFASLNTENPISPPPSIPA